MEIADRGLGDILKLANNCAEPVYLITEDANMKFEICCEPRSGLHRATSKCQKNGTDQKYFWMSVFEIGPSSSEALHFEWVEQRILPNLKCARQKKGRCS